jgi:hypothetical protein
MTWISAADADMLVTMAMINTAMLFIDTSRSEARA